MKFREFLTENQQILLIESVLDNCPELLVGSKLNPSTLPQVLLKMIDLKSQWHTDKLAPKCVDSIMKVLNPDLADELKKTCTSVENCDDKIDYEKNKAAKDAITDTYITIERILRELISKVDKDAKVNVLNYTKKISTMLVQKHKQSLN